VVPSSGGCTSSCLNRTCFLEHVEPRVAEPHDPHQMDVGHPGAENCPGPDVAPPATVVRLSPHPGAPVTQRLPVWDSMDANRPLQFPNSSGQRPDFLRQPAKRSRFLVPRGDESTAAAGSADSRRVWVQLTTLPFMARGVAPPPVDVTAVDVTAVARLDSDVCYTALKCPTLTTVQGMMLLARDGLRPAVLRQLWRVVWGFLKVEADAMLGCEFIARDHSVFKAGEPPRQGPISWRLSTFRSRSLDRRIEARARVTKTSPSWINSLRRDSMRSIVSAGSSEPIARRR
jgi:hypothetical protein